MQRLYNRKKAFDSLYNSKNENLTPDIVLEYWSHLMKHTAINEPNHADLHFEDSVIEFNQDLLIYPDEIEKI